ncbi:MAG: hypothetical protein ABF868_02735 [Sporolactobacillus sp.]
MKRMFIILSVVCLFLIGPAALTHAQLSKPTTLFPSRQFRSAEELKHTADTIVIAHVNEDERSWSTGKRTDSGHRLMNARQTLRISSTLKGRALSTACLLTTGVQPLPPPHSSLNLLYTGPLAEGDYALFLKKYGIGCDFLLNGGFSAVYPLYDGKTIALDQGFSEFGSKTPAELKAALGISSP